MPVYRIPLEPIWFPTPDLFEPEEGIVAMGGDLSPKRMLAAYYMGIFPWFNPGEEILWWQPINRMVLKPHEVKISKSSRNLINQKKFTITYNQAFAEVMEQCQNLKRKGQNGGTWISDDIKHSFIELNKRGYAHSVETWLNGELVGGLYGMLLGTVFMGDSMFSKVSNASKMAFIDLCKILDKSGYDLIDCQVHTKHLESLGAYEIPREEFNSMLEEYRSKRPELNPFS